MMIDDKSFLLVAMHHYQNPSCVTLTEFEEDLKRITYIKKLLKKPDKNVRLILNHIITFFNVFGSASLYLLLHKMDYEDIGTLATFLLYLHQMPDVIPEYNISLVDLKLNEEVIKTLRAI